jgi:DNA-binding LacI/PurR family transcriptional regulator
LEKRVTIAEVARAAGVSKTTVSVVLNGGADALGIRPETQSQVLDAATSLGYTPNYAARMLRRGRTGTLTMLVQALANPFFVDMAVAARGAAEARGYELVVVDAGPLDAEVRALEHLRGGRTDGVVVATGRHHSRRPAVERLIELVDHGMPAVVLIDKSPDDRVPAIRPDVYGGSLEAMRHLVGLGHRRIAHIAMQGAEELESAPSSQGDRYRAYVDALTEAGIELDRRWLVRGPDTSAGGRGAMHDLLGVRPRPTAVFVYNDLTAIGVLRACAEAGVRVPDEVAVVSFDGIELGGFMTPALTTVENPGVDMGRRAIQTLFDLMAGQPPSEIDRVLPARLLVRESCGARAATAAGTTGR